MTRLTLYLAYNNWLAVRQAIHGPLSVAEQALVQELLQFLVDVADGEGLATVPREWPT